MITQLRHRSCWPELRIAMALVVACCALALSDQAAAQGSPDARPTPGSAQRAAIMNALRPAVEAKLGPGIRFVGRCVRVWNGWAFVDAEPQRKDGRPIPPRLLPDWQERDGVTVTALLSFRYGRWNLIDHAIGATDAWYDGQAPRPLLRSRCY